jgi:hypothetical protein
VRAFPYIGISSSLFARFLLIFDVKFFVGRYIIIKKSVVVWIPQGSSCVFDVVLLYMRQVYKMNIGYMYFNSGRILGGC